MAREARRLTAAYPSSVGGADEIWLPLVDEPIGDIVAAIEADDPAITATVGSPRALLAFRTFAYIRVGIALGQLLFEEDVTPYDGSATWVEQLLREPRHRERLVREVRAVADQIAADERYADDDVGSDASARTRFLEFARRQRG